MSLDLRRLGTGENWLERLTGGQFSARDITTSLRTSNDVQRRHFEELEELVKAAQEEVKRGTELLTLLRLLDCTLAKVY